VRGRFFYCEAVPPRWTAHKNSPKLENGFGGHLPISGMAKQPTKNAVFLLGGLIYYFSAELKEIFNLS